MQIIDLTKLARYDHDLKEWLPIKRRVGWNEMDQVVEKWWEMYVYCEDDGQESTVYECDCNGNHVFYKDIYIENPDGEHGELSLSAGSDISFRNGVNGYYSSRLKGIIGEIREELDMGFSGEYIIPTTAPSNPSAGSCYFSRSGLYGNLHIYDGNDWFVVGMQIEAIPDEEGDPGRPE